MNVKNIILYDADANVVGFVELVIEVTRTTMKVGHNFDKEGLILSMTAGGHQQTFNLESSEKFSVGTEIDLKDEVFVVLMRRGQGELASGISSGGAVDKMRKGDLPRVVVDVGAEMQSQCQKNVGVGEDLTKPLLDMLGEEVVPKLQTVAAKEVDEMLRVACSFEQEGLNACEKCPYRQDFFQVASGEKY